MKQKVSKNFPRPCTFPTVTISETWRKLLLNFKCPGSAFKSHLQTIWQKTERPQRASLYKTKSNTLAATLQLICVFWHPRQILWYLCMIITILTKTHTKKSVNIDSPYFTFPAPASFWKTFSFICIWFVFVKFWTVQCFQFLASPCEPERVQYTGRLQSNARLKNINPNVWRYRGIDRCNTRN